MTRLSRKESHAQTRARLVATAKELFLAEGYNATSLEQVTRAAGYTKGAVYSNFATKHELGLAVLDEVHAERTAAIAQSVGGARTAEERIAAFAGWAEANIGDVGWTVLEVEFATSTRHLPEMQEELAQRRQLLTGMVALMVQTQADELGLTLPVPADEAAVSLLGLGIGLGVQRAFDPSLPVTSLIEMLRRLLSDAQPGQV